MNVPRPKPDESAGTQEHRWTEWSPQSRTDLKTNIPRMTCQNMHCMFLPTSCFILKVIPFREMFLYLLTVCSFFLHINWLLMGLTCVLFPSVFKPVPLCALCQIVFVSWHLSSLSSPPVWLLRITGFFFIFVFLPSSSVWCLYLLTF